MCAGWSCGLEQLTHCATAPLEDGMSAGAVARTVEVGGSKVMEWRYTNNGKFPDCFLDHS